VRALDGINLFPVVRGERPAQPRTLVWRTFQRDRQKALRHGDWKYLHDGKQEYLFEVMRDPSEKQDRKAEEPKRFEELKELFRVWETSVLAPVTLENKRMPE
jgi:hypothetical protein